MQDNLFDSVPRIEFDPPEQETISAEAGVSESVTPEPQVPSEESLSTAIVQDYNNTIEFINFIESLIDDRLKDLEITIDPEAEPEVWAAMIRIFDNPNPKISYDAYKDIMAALEQISEIEADEADPGDDLTENLFGEVEDLLAANNVMYDVLTDSEDPVDTSDDTDYSNDNTDQGLGVRKSRKLDEAKFAEDRLTKEEKKERLA